MAEHFTGLTEAEVLASREKHGPNTIPDSEPTTFWEEFKETFGDPMIRILLVIAAIMIAMWAFGKAEIYEPVGTIIAVLIVAVVSAKTGVASDTKYRELKSSIKRDQCKVYRGGAVSVIDVDDVVVGDKVILISGDKLPADGVLISGELRVNNSALNGEMEECPKDEAPQDVHLPDDVTGDTLVDRHSLFRGTVVFDGDGVMSVERVGTATMMGRMAEEMNAGEPDSPLKVKLSKLAGQISVFGYVGASVITLFYLIYFVMKAGGLSAYMSLGAGQIVQDVVSAVSLGIVIVVCAVPEGLPLMISLVLMQNTSKMLDRNVLVRTAIGIETSGSLNILFSDKTGTITKGQLEVVNFYTGDCREFSREALSANTGLDGLVTASIGRNTQAMFDDAGNAVGGNMTDRALLEYIGEAAFKGLDDDPRLAVTGHQAFNSANKFSQARIDGIGRTFYKGAPERLINAASGYVDAEGEIKPLDKEALNKLIDGLAERAMRVLAIGMSEAPMQADKINDGMVLIGLAAIRDDVRPDAREAIREVRGAGIQVVMITGDRLETAKAIARDAELLTDDGIAITSAELGAMSDEEVKAIVPKLRVIARALPTDKSRMVRVCQEMNLVVGMTGDGVNDSPSLKRADVGFAMGSGTEAAKEAGEIIILDDNFKSIKDAIWYGRTIYHNILKFCKFQLVINVSAVVVSAIAPFLGVDEPLKVTHLLFVNLVMDSLGALMFGGEPALEKYMKEKPRRRDESIISRRMAAQILVMGAWMTIISFVYLKLPFFIDLFKAESAAAIDAAKAALPHGIDGVVATGIVEKAAGLPHLTGYFVMFILCALFNGFNVRDDGFNLLGGIKENPNFIRIMLCIIAVQAVIVNAALIPGEVFRWIGNMFSCVPFGVNGWLAAAALALTMIPVDMIRKALTPKG